MRRVGQDPLAEVVVGLHSHPGGSAPCCIDRCGGRVCVHRPSDRHLCHRSLEVVRSTGGEVVRRCADLSVTTSVCSTRVNADTKGGTRALRRHSRWCSVPCGRNRRTTRRKSK